MKSEYQIIGDFLEKHNTNIEKFEQCAYNYLEKSLYDIETQSPFDQATRDILMYLFSKQIVDTYSRGE